MTLSTAAAARAPSRRSVGRAIAAAVLLLSTTGCAGSGSTSAVDETAPSEVAPASSTPRDTPHRPHTGGAANVATAAPSQTVAQRPVSIELPSGVVVAVDATATGTDGDLQIPSDVRRAGWWDGSSRLGDPFGSVVIAAHVDSFTQGLGRFAELLSARPGDVLTMDSAAHTQRYRVTSAGLVAKSAVTAGSHLFAVGGEPRLVLVTCGGVYDAAHGGYQDNQIVVATPIGPLRQR